MAVPLMAMVSGAWAADKIRMSSRATNWDLVLLESGVAEKYDLDIEIVPEKGGADVANALVGGSIDVASVGATPLVSLLSKTKSVVVISSTHITDGSYVKVLVRPDSDLKSIDDLKGRKIATQIGSGSYNALVDYCKQSDCKLSDFQILNTPPTSVIAALGSGSVDAALWFPPTTSIAVANGSARLLADFKGVNIGGAAWVVRRAFAEANPDVVTRFVAAMFEAQAILQNEPDRAAELIETAMKRRGTQGITASIIRDGLGDFDYRPIIDGKLLEAMQAAYASLVEIGKMSGAEPDFAAAIDRTYFDAAKKLAAGANQ
jgi:ABC-type nitrate/sulfonate/bicarbonate transport system substrate-binding protein